MGRLEGRGCGYVVGFFVRTGCVVFLVLGYEAEQSPQWKERER